MGVCRYYVQGERGFRATRNQLSYTPVCACMLNTIKHRVQNPRRVTKPWSIASTHAQMCLTARR